MKDTDILSHYTGAAWALFADIVVSVFIQTGRFLGHAVAGLAREEIACTAAGRALLDDADAAAQRTTLGLERCTEKHRRQRRRCASVLNGASTTWAGNTTVEMVYPFRVIESDAPTDQNAGGGRSNT